MRTVQIPHFQRQLSTHRTAARNFLASTTFHDASSASVISLRSYIIPSLARRPCFQTFCWVFQAPFAVNLRFRNQALTPFLCSQRHTSVPCFLGQHHRHHLLAWPLHRLDIASADWLLPCTQLVSSAVSQDARASCVWMSSIVSG